MKIDVDKLQKLAEEVFYPPEGFTCNREQQDALDHLVALARVGAAHVEHHLALCEWDSKRTGETMDRVMDESEALHRAVETYLTTHPEGVQQ